MNKTTVNRKKLHIIEHSIKDSKPVLLIHSGTHGDEYGVVSSVKKAIRKYHDLLPSFLYVPHVSPSGMQNCSRVNINGNDLNREFSHSSNDEEIIENIKIVSPYKFKLCINFHEDLFDNRFYMYDTYLKSNQNEIITDFLNLMSDSKIQLFEGIDDPQDPNLGHYISNGYVGLNLKENPFNDGSFCCWGVNNKVMERSLLPEIPGVLPQKTKDFIVDKFFTEVILKWNYNI